MIFAPVEKEKIHAVIFIGRLKVEGIIHLLPQERVTDFLDADDVDFLPVSCATVFHVDSREDLHTSKFMSLNKKETGYLSCGFRSKNGWLLDLLQVVVFRCGLSWAGTCLRFTSFLCL